MADLKNNPPILYDFLRFVDAPVAMLWTVLLYTVSG